jgi:hypothetical protein
VLIITAIVAILVSLLITGLAIGSLVAEKKNSVKINLVQSLLTSRINELIKANIDVGRVQERNAEQKSASSSDGYHIIIENEK